MFRLVSIGLLVASIGALSSAGSWTKPFNASASHAKSLAEEPYLDNHPNPRYALIKTAPGTILAFNDAALLYRANDGAHILYDDERADAWIPITDPALSSQTSFLTAGGAVVVHDGPTPTVYELSGGRILLRPDIRSVSHQDNFGVFISPTESRSFLRNFWSDTNLVIAQPLFSADVTSEGIVYMSAFNLPGATNTTLYRFDAGELTQIEAETNHVQGRVRTDGTNVLWFSAPFTLDTNGFQIYLLTPAGRVQLATNYVPPFASWIEEPPLALVKNGWTIFPTLDANGVQQVWRRAPDGAITQATFFAHHTVPFDLRSDGAFVALVFKTQSMFSNHLYFVSPGAAPLDLGRRYATDYRFVGDRLIALHEGFAYSVDLSHPNPTRLYLPAFDSSGAFSCYVTSSQEITTFRFEHSSDLQTWTDISSPLTATPQPTKFQVAAPPGFIRTRQP